MLSQTEGDVMNLFDLHGKTAVVIGDTSTLGTEMAIGLAGHGAGVALVGYDMEKSQNCGTAYTRVWRGRMGRNYDSQRQKRLLSLSSFWKATC